MIPRILHFIWLGEDAARPEHLLATWVHHNPDWTIKVWGRDDLASAQWKFGAALRALAAVDPDAAAGLLRWEILQAEGGLVFDIHSACLRPLDDSLLQAEVFCCWENELAAPGKICARFAGSVPANAFVASVLDGMGGASLSAGSCSPDPQGSDRLARLWQSQEYEGLLIHPSHYFIPRHPSGRNYDGAGRVYAVLAWSDLGQDAGAATAPAGLGATAAAAVLPALPSEVPPLSVAPPPAGPAGAPGTTAAIMNLNFFCHVEKSGLGRHCHSVMASLQRIQPPQTRINYLDCKVALSGRLLVANGRPATDTTVFFHRYAVDFIRQVPGRRILWTVFETDRLPGTWLEQIRAHDAVWTPSHWCRDVLVAHGLDAQDIQVVEEGVDEKIFHPAPLLHAGFVFLSVGKYEARKSIDEIIEAFVTEFPAASAPSVRLWLKADYPGQPARAQLLRQCVAADPRIRIISDSLTDAELARLYNSADAFVFPSKAEGFGLPCIEAIACGLPVIATDTSGQATILAHIPGRFVPVEFAMAPIDDADFRNFFSRDYEGEDFGRWAQPSIASLRRGMRTLYEDRAAWRERGLEASRIIREHLTWDRIALRVRDLLCASPKQRAPAIAAASGARRVDRAALPVAGDAAAGVRARLHG